MLQWHPLVTSLISGRALPLWTLNALLLLALAVGLALGSERLMRKFWLERILEHPQPLAAPPAGFAPTLRAAAEFHADDPYAIPIGWQSSDGVPDLVTGSLHGDSPYFVGNVQVTAMTRWGKNIWEFLVTTTLLYRATPGQLRIFQIDGKGPDGALWRGLAHNWRVPITREADLPGAIAALEGLRAERMRVLEQHAVTKWEELSVQLEQ